MTAQGHPRLFLVDGYALIYRAFFAMINRPLRTSRGENTSAVWGIANFLHRLFAEHHPEYVAWVHDSGTSFRDEIYPDYKATREKLNDELQEDFDRSLERIETLLDAWGLKLIAVAGFEADDVIGSLAARAVDAGFDVVIISGDKDFYQLIAPGVSLLNPGRGGPAGVDEQWVDLSNAHERLGVSPDRVVDYLALVGDASDNVPGVKGVGAKTAQKLISAYGDLDEVLAHAAEVSGKRAREALLRDAEQARLSRRLVTIRKDVPVDVDLTALRTGDVDRGALGSLYRELEFDSLLDRVGDAEPLPMSPADYDVVDSPERTVALVRVVREAQTLVLETLRSDEDVMRARLVGLAATTGKGRSWYLPFAHRLAEGELTAEPPPRNLPSLLDPTMQEVRALLEDAAISKVGHDLKQAVLILRQEGVTLAGLEYDTMLASFVVEPGRRTHALEMLASEHLRQEVRSQVDLLGKGRAARDPAAVTLSDAAAWGCARVTAVAQLRHQLSRELDARAGRSLFEEIEMPLVEVLADLEWHGITLDAERLSLLAQQFSEELAELEREIYEEAGTAFNINSTQQLRHVLFEKLQLPVVKRTKTGPSTDADVLAELVAQGYRLPTLLLRYRELSKLRSTYIDSLPQRVNPATGRIHTSFSQTGAATGRLSSSDPNLQNIPIRTPRGEEIRRCFIVGPGMQLIVADYSQIELRLLAHLSQDPAFIAAFQSGGDVHRETAAIIFDVPADKVTAEMRAQAKTINFATIYGQGAFSLARQLGIPQDEAKEFIRLYFERFAGVRRFLDGCIDRARELGYAETLFHRRRYIPELKDRSFNVRAFGERVAMNSPLQGSAADLIKRAMITLWKVFREEGLDSRMLLQVHDELVIEAPEAEVDRVCGLVRREMISAAELSIPLLVDVGVGRNWLDAKA